MPCAPLHSTRTNYVSQQVEMIALSKFGEWMLPVSPHLRMFHLCLTLIHNSNVENFQRTRDHRSGATINPPRPLSSYNTANSLCIKTAPILCIPGFINPRMGTPFPFTYYLCTI